VAHPQIAVFARLAKENAVPTRLLAGQATKLSRTMHDIRYDEAHDELYVSNPFAAAILVFRGGANGEEAPIRIIQGPGTQLEGPDRLDVDPVNNEIIVPEAGNTILVYPRTASGNVAPLRVIKGPDTQLRGIRSVAVDTVRNLLVGGTQYRKGNIEEGILLIYRRTANGNVKPLRVIQGPKTEIVRITQLQVYPPTGWILAAQAGTHDALHPDDGFIGIWSINDDGDVPPRWKIRGPNSTLIKPRGIALDPQNKSLIVSDMARNAVLTFYFPEVF
jgi:hypothetical protein